jgi:hypothetical protein
MDPSGEVTVAWDRPTGSPLAHLAFGLWISRETVFWWSEEHSILKIQPFTYSCNMYFKMRSQHYTEFIYAYRCCFHWPKLTIKDLHRDVGYMPLHKNGYWVTRRANRTWQDTVLFHMFLELQEVQAICRWVWTFRVRLSSPNACLIIVRDCATLFPRCAQNVMHTCCRINREVTSGQIHDSK